MSWKGVKKQSYEQEIKSWCEERGIKNYTINSQGEIDVDDNVDLIGREFKELPYKFGTVKYNFALCCCTNLTSLKNCPNYVGGFFSCSRCPQLNSLEGCPKVVVGYFNSNDCNNLESLEGCPKEVGRDFYCRKRKNIFTEKEIRSLCKVGRYIYRE